MKYIGDAGFDTQDIITRVYELSERYPSVGTLSGRVLFRPRISPPPQVYKYTSAANAKLILSDLTLRYTQSEVFDDVFEEAPCREEIRQFMPEFEDGPTLVVDVMDPEDRLKMFDRVKSARSNMRRNGVTLSDDVTIITANGLHRDWKYELGNRQLKYTMEEFRRPLALSLTELRSSLKMWSGYGDAHRGVRFGFNTRTPYFRSNRDLIGREGYFAPIEYRQISVEDYAYRFPHERFFTKTPEWQEQREWRRITFVKNIPGIDWKNAVYTFSFPPESLSTVSFGARCAEEDVRVITEQVRSNIALRHVTFTKTKKAVGKLVEQGL
jgi:hypothetical protein